MKKRPKFYNLLVGMGNNLYIYGTKFYFMEVNRKRDLGRIAVYAITNLFFY